MKTLLFSILFSTFSFFAIASSSNAEPVKSMEKQVSELIQKSDLYKSIADQNQMVMVKFTFNTDNEIIVLSTDSKDYDKTLKNIMNYKTLELDEDLTNKVFILPIRMEMK